MPLRPHQLSAVVSHSKPSRIVLTRRPRCDLPARGPRRRRPAGRAEERVEDEGEHDDGDHSRPQLDGDVRSRPSVNSRPRPPRPMSAPTLISDTVLTVGQPQPGDDAGQRRAAARRRRSGRAGGSPCRRPRAPPARGTARIASTMFRTRITSVYSVIADDDRLVVGEAERRREQHEEGDRRDRVDRVRHRSSTG